MREANLQLLVQISTFLTQKSLLTTSFQLLPHAEASDLKYHTQFLRLCLDTVVGVWRSPLYESADNTSFVQTNFFAISHQIILPLISLFFMIFWRSSAVKLSLCLVAIAAASMASRQLGEDGSGQPKGQTSVYQGVFYQGQDNVLAFKLAAMSSYVDYFIVVEPEDIDAKRSDADPDNAVKFYFDPRRFMEYSHKIVYLPIRNLPHRKFSRNEQDNYENLRYIQNSLNRFFQVHAHNNDIIILSDVGEIISEDAVNRFKTSPFDYACAQMKLFQGAKSMVVHDDEEANEKNVRWNQYARLITIKGLMQRFQNSTFDAWRNSKCQSLEAISENNISLLRDAGWKFTYGNNENVLEEAKSIKEGSYLIQIDPMSMEWPQIMRDALLKVDAQQFQNKNTKRINKSLRFPVFTEPVSDRLGYSQQNNSADHEQVEEVKTRRLVLSCFPYNGEDHLLQLKLSIYESFVDYLLITEGTFSHTGYPKKLVFDYSKFQNYAHKILYLPLRNFPGQNVSLTADQRWQNEHFNRYAVRNLLSLLALPKDVLLLEDLDEMLSRQALTRFNPDEVDWVNNQLRMFYWYLNRMSVFNLGQKRQLPNALFNGAKTVTYHVLRRDYKEDSVRLRRGIGCNLDVKSRLAKQQVLKCDGKNLELAGWHFSYVLDDRALIKKIRSFADSQDINFTLRESIRSQGVAPEGGLLDVGLFDGYLPIQLVLDLISKGQDSIFAPFLHGIDLSPFNSQVNQQISSSNQEGVDNRTQQKPAKAQASPQSTDQSEAAAQQPDAATNKQKKHEIPMDNGTNVDSLEKPTSADNSQGIVESSKPEAQINIKSQSDNAKGQSSADKIFAPNTETSTQSLDRNPQENVGYFVYILCTIIGVVSTIVGRLIYELMRIILRKSMPVIAKSQKGEKVRTAETFMEPQL